MKTWIKVASLVFVLALLAAFTLYDSTPKAVYTSADFPYYDDSAALAKAADVIVEGTVVKVHAPGDINISTENDKEVKVKYTVSDIEVTEVIKGDVKVGDIIQVKQLGSEDGVVNEELKNTGYFKKGMESIFFLQSYKSISPDMPYSTMTPYQGHIIFENDKVKANEYNKLFKEGADKKAVMDEIKAKL